MSRAVFDQHRRSIDVQISAMLAGSKSRKRFRLAALYEKKTGTLLAEVMETNHGPVVRYRDASNKPAVDPLTDDPQQEFAITGRTGRYTIQGAYFAAQISTGTERFTVSYNDGGTQVIALGIGRAAPH